MDSINWEMLKFKYEVLGCTLESIVEQDDISLPLLQHAAKQWKPLHLSEMQEIDLSSITSFDELINKLQKSTISQSKAFEILKERFLSTKYVKLEVLLVNKAIETINQMNYGNTSLTDISKNLKAVSEVLIMLKGKNGSSSLGTDFSSGSISRDDRLNSMRLHYEYGGKSIKDLCDKYSVTIDEIKAFAREQGWTKKKLKNLDAKGIKEFYVEARRNMSVSAVKRSVLIADRLAAIESDLMNMVEAQVKNIKSSPEDARSTDLARYSKILNDLKSSNNMVGEALRVPASADPDRELDDLDDERVIEIIRTIRKPKLVSDNSKGEKTNSKEKTSASA